MFLGMGTNPRFVSWVAWEGEVWLFFKVRMWEFFNFRRNYSFGGVGWVVGERGWGGFFSR